MSDDALMKLTLLPQNTFQSLFSIVHKFRFMRGIFVCFPLQIRGYAQLCKAVILHMCSPLGRGVRGASLAQGKTSMSDDLLTADELATVLDVRPGTIRRWARDGIIPAIRISPKTVRYCYADVLAALRGLSTIDPVEGCGS